MQVCNLCRKIWRGSCNKTTGGVRYLEYTLWAASETQSTPVQIGSSIQHREGLVALSRFTIHTKNWVWVKVWFGGVKKQGHDNYVPRRQLGSCSVTRPFLSLRRVWLVRLLFCVPGKGRKWFLGGGVQDWSNVWWARDKIWGGGRQVSHASAFATMFRCNLIA